MRIGSFEVLTILEGCFRLDGGSMFGIIPRTLWSRSHPPDENNRIIMALRTLLIVGPERRILVDCGIGDRFDEDQQRIYRHERRPEGIAGALGRLGYAADDITDVVATHLHFDHVGGMLAKAKDGRLIPTFPKATVHVQQAGWDWARNPGEWDRGSFFWQDFDIWERDLDLRLVRGDCQIIPGVRLKLTSGHTPGQQIVVVGQGTGSLVYCADLIPTATHVRLPYIMAYDHRPQNTLEEKKVLLARALEEDWILVFEHDPFIPACRLEEKDGRVIAGQKVCVNLPMKKQAERKSTSDAAEAIL